MKRMKKFLATLMAFAMIFAVMSTAGLTAKAADSYKITVKPEDSLTHTYEAYQIFTGKVVEDTSVTPAVLNLIDIDWGTGVDSDALLTSLVENNSTFGGVFSTGMSAEQVANELIEFGDDSEKTVAFAKLVGKNLTSVKKTSVKADGEDNVYDITELPGGYYLVRDENASLPTDENDVAYTRNLLKLAGDVEIEPKPVTPTVEKKIVEGEEKVNANTAAVGDVINYVISSTVPDMTGYDKYFFVFEDTLSKGLTLDTTSIEVYVDSTKLDASAYDISYNDGTGVKENAENKIEIVLKNFIQYRTKSGRSVEVKYSATLNENANITTAGNPNTVDLVYSNNPNVTPSGQDKPNDTDKENKVVGKTPESEVITYTTAIRLTKVDAKTGKVLSGAEFKIEGDTLNVVLRKTTSFVENEEGTYYKLKDGTYTTEGANEETKDQYESTTVKYKEVETQDSKETAEGHLVTAVVDANGVLVLEGLNAGTYTITETKAPDGYNKLKDSITLTIEANPSLTACEWTVTKGTETLDLIAGDEYGFTVQNNKGITLPSTGGIGTTIFYVVGGILVVGAAILLVTKKRMSVEED